MLFVCFDGMNLFARGKQHVVHFALFESLLDIDVLARNYDYRGQFGEIDVRRQMGAFYLFEQRCDGDAQSTAPTVTVLQTTIKTTRRRPRV
jgi:hypothetical protein